MRNFLKLTMLCFTLLIVYNTAQAQNNRLHYVPGELIIKFREGYTSAKTNQLANKMQAKVVETMPTLTTQLWKTDQNNAKLDVLELVEQYKDHPDIEYIEPNYLYSISNIESVNDPDFGKQWALHNTGEKINTKADADIDAPEAWEIQSESPTIVVGILDTGIDWRHSDLIDNIWQNLGEDANGNGTVLVFDSLNARWVFDPEDVKDTLDNDKNGFVNDFIGWNFVDNNNEPFDYEALEAGAYVQSHGTHVAGIIGATGNDEGISGVTRKVQLAPLKFLNDGKLPNGEAWSAAKAILYADTMGFQITNNSWGGVYGARIIEEAIYKANKNNGIFIASAGNGGWDKIGDNDPHYYPAGYNIDNIIAVANTDYTDNLNQSSNYNLYNVDIAAPGTNIYSCLPFNINQQDKPAYSYKSGTSMAAPMVAGACALIWEKATEIFNEKNAKVKNTHIINSILENTDELLQLKGTVATGGRLNIHNALSAIIDTTYTNQYIGCRNRDSLTLSAIYNALGLETFNPIYKPGTSTIDYYDTWGYDNKPMDQWHGVVLNSLGCVSELSVPNIKQQEIPAIIGQLSDLTVLETGGAGVSFSYPIRNYDADFVKLVNNYNTYTGENEPGFDESDFNIRIPAEIFNLKKLKHLSLSGTKLGGSIPPEIIQLENLESLNLSYNYLTGEIPIELYSLKKLKEINLAFNHLEGTLPEALNQLENLRDLQLVYNNLTGNLPTAIGDLYFNILDIGFNNLSGHIPDVFNNSNVHYLFLDHNELSGPIPPSFSSFDSLDEVYGFDITDNNLSGCYDPALIKMGPYLYETIFNDGRISSFGNGNISDGNNFDVTWEEFVADETMGSCWASATTKVWPGDMNNDGEVTVDDIVYYRIAADNEGPARDGENKTPEEFISWEGQLSLDWEVLVHGINGKYQDANGDGLVNNLDYQVIINNMGLTNPNHYTINELNYYANGIKMELKLVEDTGSEKVFELRLNQINDGAADFHALSADMQFNETVKSVDMEFTSGSCINESLSEKIFDTETKNFSFAISKDDFVNCDDALARIIIVAVDEVVDDGDQFLSFKVNSINSQFGVNINETAGSNSINSLSIDSDEALSINISTTPELCETGGTATAEVFGGKLPYTYHWESTDDSFWGTTITQEPTIAELVTGEYTLTVIDANDTIQSLPFEVGNAIILQYDENGNPIACKTLIEPDCPDDMNFGNDISQDTYNAAKNIYTNGNIPKDVEVQLRAGDFIQLDPGFKMESNTFLDIKIENCSDEE